MGKRKNWTADQKVALLEESKEIGVDATLRKHEVAMSTFYNWKKEYELEGKKGLSGTGQSDSAELRRLLDENMQLKQLVAEKD